MTKAGKLLSALILSGSCAMTALPAAHAQEFFVGAGFGRYDVEDDDFDENDTGWKLYTGFNFNPVVGLELSWVDFNEAREGGNSFDADGLGAAVLLHAPLGPNFSIYGKAGQFFWDSDVGRTGVPGVVSDDGDDPFFGAGVKFKLGEPLDLRLEWERFDVADADFDFVSANLQFSF